MLMHQIFLLYQFFVLSAFDVSGQLNKNKKQHLHCHLPYTQGLAMFLPLTHGEGFIKRTCQVVHA